MAQTKILPSDLDADLQQLLTDLENAKDTKPSLTERLSEMDQGLTDADSNISTLQSNVADLQKATQDLPSATDVKDLQTKVSELAEYGNFNEQFEYDANGNVTKHTVTGDVSFVESFTYADAMAGTLQDSSKVYTDQDNKTVTIKRVYTYDNNGNITVIAATTTKV